VVSADIAYENREYTTAAALFTEEYEKEEDNILKAVTAEKIGDCYVASNKTIQAENWYEKAIPFTTNPELSFKYGLMLKRNEKYDQAINVFKEYAIGNPIERAKAKQQINSCRLALDWVKDKNSITVENLNQINSDASDYAPFWYENKGLIFTSARSTSKGEAIYGWTGEKHSDIYYAAKEDNNRFAMPTPFSDVINTEFNEGTITFSPDFKEAYFTKCGSTDLIDNYCKIFVTNKDQDGNWTEPERVFLFDSDSINVGQPFLSPDAKFLYYSADAPDSFGDKDLYISKKTIEGWSPARNLGPEINTALYEGFPFIHTDGKLYFSSDGHLGMGGLDIFSAELIDDTWKNIENLKHPINSSADDFSIIMEPFISPEELDKIISKGYFSSTRKGGKGNDDIYQFTLGYPVEEEVVEIDSTEIKKELEKEKEVEKGLYYLEVTVLENQFEYPDNPSSKIMGQIPLKNSIVDILGLDIDSTLSERLVTDSKGKSILKISPKNEYKVSASNAGYFKQSKTVNSNITSNEDSVIVKVSFVLDKIFKQQEIVIDNIYYDLDKADIREDALPILDKLAILLKENPNIKIELGAHTDSRGSPRYNQNLSQNRAESVVNYLISKKVTANRLLAKGYGETKLLNDCSDGVDCSEEEHQINRRTTFKVF